MEQGAYKLPINGGDGARVQLGIAGANGANGNNEIGAQIK